MFFIWPGGGGLPPPPSNTPYTPNFFEEIAQI